MNADDKEKQRKEITDVGEKMFNDVFKKQPDPKLNPFDEALLKARRVKQILHIAGCKIVKDSEGFADPHATKKVLVDIAETYFKEWSKEELVFYMVNTFAKMELADIGVPDL